MSEEDNIPEESTEQSQDDSDCMSCDALDLFCENIEDPEKKRKCMISTQAVQEGLMDADYARDKIMEIIGPEQYQKNVDKVNDWITEKLKDTRSEIRKVARKDGEPVKSLPEEKEVPTEPIDKEKSDKFLPEE